MADHNKNDGGRIETRSGGFDESARTPATPSDRAEWERERHADALEYHKKQNERAGMDGQLARRNQYCQKCKGVVAWNVERCPHCQAEIKTELRDYYNFSDFEAPVDRRELLPILTAFLVIAAAVGALGWGLFVGFRWLFGGG